jgi:hypothetical protein
MGRWPLIRQSLFLTLFPTISSVTLNECNRLFSTTRLESLYGAGTEAVSIAVLVKNRLLAHHKFTIATAAVTPWRVLPELCE